MYRYEFMLIWLLAFITALLNFAAAYMSYQVAKK